MKELDIVLGTALWGWAIDKSTAFSILDEFCSNGYNLVDTATNYPLNKNSDHYLLAIKWLAEWSHTNPNSILKIIVKVGSIDNSGSSDFDLSSKRINTLVEEIQSIFPFPIFLFSTHWDNRGEGDELDILETITSFIDLFKQGYQVGLSGLKNPNLYYTLGKEFSPNWLIQVKENIFTSQARQNYSVSFKSNKYYAYGINHGGVDLKHKRELVSSRIRGIKVEESEISKIYKCFHDLFPEITFENFNQLAILHSCINPYLSGIIIGPRNFDQLSSSLDHVKQFIQAGYLNDTKMYNEINQRFLHN